MGANQDRLAAAIFALGRRGKATLITQYGATSVSDLHTVNLIGQAAVVQGHIPFLLEALATVSVREVPHRHREM